MDAALKDLLASYQTGLKTYFDSLPSDNSEVVNAKNLLKDMEALAESSQDYSAFMAEAQRQNYFTEIISFYTKLGNELYKLKPRNNKIPSATEIAKGYHLAYDSIGEAKDDPDIHAVYERVFALEKSASSGPEFIYRMEEENLFLRMSQVHLIIIMRNGLEKLLQSGIPSNSSVEQNLGVVSSPQMEHYFQIMQSRMRETNSVIEMELSAFEEAEQSRFSNLWDSTFLFTSFLSFLSPLISYRMTGSSEYKTDTREAYDFVCDFYGLNWDELFANSRIWDYFERTIYGGAKQTFNSQNINSAIELKNDLRKYLTECVENVDHKPDTTKQIVNFKGKEIGLNEVMNHLKTI